MTTGRAEHWNEAYSTKGETGVSWFEEQPDFSMKLIEACAAGKPVSVIDIGGGASRLVDAGLDRGLTMSVLDISDAALDVARARLGPRAGDVEWIVADVTPWRPTRSYDIWHDRAAFHFLIEAQDRAAYAERLREALKPGGHAIIATFALDGPERCSGLPVRRYDAAGLAEVLGDGFTLLSGHRRLHVTPWGSQQSFQYAVLSRHG
ncbi:trans-aconitate 2-methyltransferase [Mesorhizobium sp. ZMM04-5]|uniref:Trans-aconitate 2-methyltransferase n=1 Tax=Mesorhizobium marinum TaxID=3228790 RepID=A0ABV3QYB5_9HYPH